MADQDSFGKVTQSWIDQNGKQVGPSVTTPLVVHEISKQQFGLAQAPGEDNDAYARQYNTD
jgi:hypothetical protein